MRRISNLLICIFILLVWCSPLFAVTHSTDPNVDAELNVNVDFSNLAVLDFGISLVPPQFSGTLSSETQIDLASRYDNGELMASLTVYPYWRIKYGDGLSVTLSVDNQLIGKNTKDSIDWIVSWDSKDIGSGSSYVKEDELHKYDTQPGLDENYKTVVITTSDATLKKPDNYSASLIMTIKPIEEGEGL